MTMLTEEEKQRNLELHELTRNEVWVPVVERKRIPEEVRRAVGLNETPCPVCGAESGLGSERVLCRGEKTGVEREQPLRCACGFYRIYWQIFTQNVGAHDQHITLKAIAPSKNSRLPPARQASVISQLRAQPYQSRLFLGEAGTGKTTFCVALYQHALYCQLKENFLKDRADQSIWRVSVKTLMEQCRDWARQSEVRNEVGELQVVMPPMVTRKKIQAAAEAGLTPRLFLEEIDKVARTDFRMNELFDVIDAVYSSNGQVVVNSNLSQEDLARHWGDAGEMLLRRIKNDDKGKVFNFFSTK